ncbi:MAG: NADH-quinone oxidoreductase subunit L [Thermoguttaceae bacterium]
MTIPLLLILIPALPLAAALVTAALGPRVLRHASHWPAVAAVAVSCAASVLLVFAVQREPTHQRIVPLWTWAAVEEGNHAKTDATQPSPPAPLPEGEGRQSFHIDVTLRADPLTAVMLATVTFVSLLVIVYSIGYMHGDPGYWRFFTYVALFVFSMTMLVSASNFVLLYVFWEAVGLCSYLLIGFWFEKPAAAAAGMKAFLVTRVGDFGFALGVFLLWTTYGTLDFDGILSRPDLVGGGVGTAIGLLLLAGACGKSAQFPLHVWLPDAMEGPTPVSALIHAATMVTAGVYLVARCTPLFLASADARHVVAVIGGVTAAMAAVIALAQTDLKRILAYSTISQLGYMFLGLGTGTLLGVTAAMFHLVTHAFFKALLFLGAGSVMHATGGVIDVRQLGGLRHRMPITHGTFLVGCLALSGIFPFAGFWSKDAILAAVAEKIGGGDAGRLYTILYAAALATAFLTAVYTFRAFFLTFYGEERIPRQPGHEAHESPPSMTGPLVLLALGAAAAGAYFHWTGDFLGRDGFLAQTPSLAGLAGGEVEPAGSGHLVVALLSTAVAVAGVALAALLYLGRGSWLQAIVATMTGLGLYGLARGKFFFDPIYRAVVVGPLERLAQLLAWLDQHVVDALVDSVGSLVRVLGAALRPIQGGLVQFYALAMVLGVLALIGALLL